MLPLSGDSREPVLTSGFGPSEIDAGSALGVKPRRGAHRAERGVQLAF